ncbi:MAG: hypothetical protein GC154_08320 [bacterium]|nr:hypothetical protein [bacterium]
MDQEPKPVKSHIFIEHLIDFISTSIKFGAGFAIGSFIFWRICGPDYYIPLFSGTITGTLAVVFGDSFYEWVYKAIINSDMSM